MILITLLSLAVLTTGVASTVMLVLYKYNFFNWYAENKPKWLPYLCLLCVGFWICLVTAIVLNLNLDLRINWYGILVVSAASASFVWKLTQM